MVEQKGEHDLNELERSKMNNDVINIIITYDEINEYTNIKYTPVAVLHAMSQSQ